MDFLGRIDFLCRECKYVIPLHQKHRKSQGGDSKIPDFFKVILFFEETNPTSRLTLTVLPAPKFKPWISKNWRKNHLPPHQNPAETPIFPNFHGIT